MNKPGGYRDEARTVARDARWTFWRFLPLVLIVIVLLALVGFGLRSAGLIGRTVVEREVFERSFQRSESLKARIANDEAVLVEIGIKLGTANLEPNTRAQLEAQAAAARVRIATAKGMQK